MKFRDLEVGRVIEAGPYELTEQEIISFAREWDPQWFHIDPEAAAKGHFGGLIASGFHTCGIAMRLAYPVALEGSESLASPGLSHVQWPNPARLGDRLRLRIEVLEHRVSKSRPGLGIVRWHWQLFNQRDEVVLDLEAVNLFGLAQAA